MRQWGHVRLGRQGRRLRMRLSARPLHPRGGSWVARPSRRLGVSMGLRMVLSHRGMPWWLGALRLRSVTLSFCLSLSENLLLCQKSLGSRRQDHGVVGKEYQTPLATLFHQSESTVLPQSGQTRYRIRFEAALCERYSTWNGTWSGDGRRPNSLVEGQW